MGWWSVLLRSVRLVRVNITLSGIMLKVYLCLNIKPH